MVTFCPSPGVLLQSASTATTRDRTPRLHSKLDNIEWTYVGRSYGAGSSVALTQPTFFDTNASPLVQHYMYQETGYLPGITCTKNGTSAFGFELAVDNGAGGLGFYYATGSLPNEPEGVSESYPVTAFGNVSANLLGWAARSINARNTIAVASGNFNYTELNQTQCDVVFTPTIFNVSVNVTSKLISVEPVLRSTLDIEPSGNLTSNVIDSLNLLSRMSNSHYVSILGDTLSLNVQNMQQKFNASNATDEIVTSAVADSFLAIIDDVLVAYGASQIVFSEDMAPTTVVGFAEAVRIGEPAYIYAMFAVNTIIILAMIFEAIRTKIWRGLLALDYADIKSAIVSSSAGGLEIARIHSKEQDASASQTETSSCLKIGLAMSVTVPGVLAMTAVGQEEQDDKAATLLVRGPWKASGQDSVD
ncbi:hypothetical protein LTR10_021596 [Elasticomyces elasticus]|uniref:Peptidase A1 domain-containing protein n=1 Tax=Exophiala sideris TaxID=1016849 RepID=A0ABR0J7Z3_9EURO|nr:hypothetical protein LTR10_021596 [Elasticomyces elasticus]KAK5029865.1 hypothetical protein LTS07_005589 [Exophiala sideris]KAK5031696.1 hypothetical protein LTR13_007686 [Exophiala sideris]KAK5058374.1 hypothetical protein LTR69_006779 [Exophiala sideris]KAK5180303.1 hypothetical protein LTR44_007429 [Eurotiomycetes sp. CCFEE 6388]